MQQVVVTAAHLLFCAFLLKRNACICALYENLKNPIDKCIKQDNNVITLIKQLIKVKTKGEGSWKEK